jgi:hypothetical protein
MEPNKTKIRKLSNEYEIYEEPQTLFQLLLVVHKELQNIITRQKHKICYNNPKEENYEKTNKTDK